MPGSNKYDVQSNEYKKVSFAEIKARTDKGQTYFTNYKQFEKNTEELTNTKIATPDENEIEIIEPAKNEVLDSQDARKNKNLEKVQTMRPLTDSIQSEPSSEKPKFTILKRYTTPKIKIENNEHAKDNANESILSNSQLTVELTNTPAHSTEIAPTEGMTEAEQNMGILTVSAEQKTAAIISQPDPNISNNNNNKSSNKKKKKPISARAAHPASMLAQSAISQKVADYRGNYASYKAIQVSQLPVKNSKLEQAFDQLFITLDYLSDMEANPNTTSCLNANLVRQSKLSWKNKKDEELDTSIEKLGKEVEELQQKIKSNSGQVDSELKLIYINKLLSYATAKRQLLKQQYRLKYPIDKIRDTQWIESQTTPAAKQLAEEGILYSRKKYKADDNLAEKFYELFNLALEFNALEFAFEMAKLAHIAFKHAPSKNKSHEIQTRLNLYILGYAAIELTDEDIPNEKSFFTEVHNDLAELFNKPIVAEREKLLNDENSLIGVDDPHNIELNHSLLATSIRIITFGTYYDYRYGCVTEKLSRAKFLAMTLYKIRKTELEFANIDLNALSDNERKAFVNAMYVLRCLSAKALKEQLTAIKNDTSLADTDRRKLYLLLRNDVAILEAILSFLIRNGYIWQAGNDTTNISEDLLRNIDAIRSEFDLEVAAKLKEKTDAATKASAELMNEIQKQDSKNKKSSSQTSADVNASKNDRKETNKDSSKDDRKEKTDTKKTNSTLSKPQPVKKTKQELLNEQFDHEYDQAFQLMLTGNYNDYASAIKLFSHLHQKIVTLPEPHCQQLTISCQASIAECDHIMACRDASRVNYPKQEKDLRLPPSKQTMSKSKSAVENFKQAANACHRAKYSCINALKNKDLDSNELTTYIDVVEALNNLILIDTQKFNQKRLDYLKRMDDRKMQIMANGGWKPTEDPSAVSACVHELKGYHHDFDDIISSASKMKKILYNKDNKNQLIKSNKTSEKDLASSQTITSVLKSTKNQTQKPGIQKEPPVNTNNNNSAENNNTNSADAEKLAVVGIFATNDPIKTVSETATLSKKIKKKNTK